jgi:hypothetical protein
MNINFSQGVLGLTMNNFTEYEHRICSWAKDEIFLPRKLPKKSYFVWRHLAACRMTHVRDVRVTALCVHIESSRSAKWPWLPLKMNGWKDRNIRRENETVIVFAGSEMFGSISREVSDISWIWARGLLTVTRPSRMPSFSPIGATLGFSADSQYGDTGCSINNVAPPGSQ